METAGTYLVTGIISGNSSFGFDDELVEHQIICEVHDKSSRR